MDNKHFSGLEERIRDSVQDAIDSMDFNNLNKRISGTVNEALSEARGQFMNGLHSVWNQRQNSEAYASAEAKEDQGCEAHGPAGADKTQSHEAYNSDGAEGERSRTGYGSVMDRLLRRRKSGSRADSGLCRRGRVSGIVLTVLGGMGLCVMVVLFLVAVLLSLAVKPSWGIVISVFAFLSVFALAFAIMLGAGIVTGKRLKRAEIYLQKAGERLYCDILELAQSVGRSRRYVARDLRRMIEKGILLNAHIDEQKTCLMLDDETYLQYLKAQESLKQRELSAREKEGEEPDPRSDALREMMNKGQAYLEILREASGAVPGQAISGKITRLATVIRKILETVERKPKQVEELERFMDYYLPTTVKLVTAYRDFDRVKIEGDNISSAKREIEETLDTINMAFERLLDDLYQSDAMDVAADASVLQTMLEKDGFAKSDFDRREEQ